MGWVLLVLLVVAITAVAVVARRRSQAKELERNRLELEPVKKLAFEDITALGMELQDLDEDLTGRELDKGTRADYQRALDAYESAKFSGDYMTKPEEITNVTKILDDGRYAIACVRARAEGQALPARRPACFFDPRHGMAVEDVLYAPPGGVERDVPACALDAERVKAGAEPDTRLVMVGSERVPYYQGGRAYAPYAAGYFGSFGPMEWMFMGMMFGGGFDGLGEGLGDLAGGVGDGIGNVGEGIGDMFGGLRLSVSALAPVGEDAAGTVEHREEMALLRSRARARAGPRLRAGKDRHPSLPVRSAVTPRMATGCGSLGRVSDYELPITTALELPGATVRENLGIAFGLVVRSMGLSRNMTAAFSSLRKGEVSQYTELLEDARRHAIDRMVANAKLFGANAIVSMRFDSSEMGNGLTEVVAYGTAVVVDRAG